MSMMVYCLSRVRGTMWRMARLTVAMTAVLAWPWVHHTLASWEGENGKYFWKYF